MVTRRHVARFWSLHKRLVKHKSFLVQIEKSGWATARKNLIRKASSSEIFTLKDLIKSVVEKNISISSEVYKLLESSGKIPYLLRQFKKNTRQLKNQNILRSVLLRLVDILPLFIRSILKDV